MIFLAPRWPSDGSTAVAISTHPAVGSIVLWRKPSESSVRPSANYSHIRCFYPCRWLLSEMTCSQSADCSHPIIVSQSHLPCRKSCRFASLFAAAEDGFFRFLFPQTPPSAAALLLIKSFRVVNFSIEKGKNSPHGTVNS